MVLSLVLNTPANIVSSYLLNLCLLPQVHRTKGPRGRHSCDFAHVAGGHLLLVCIMAGESTPYQQVLKKQKGKVTVYEIQENPITPGRGTLTYKFVFSINADSPRYVETWCGNYSKR